MAKCVIIQGLGFGDESKGSTVEFFTKNLNAKNVIRFNGGAQAGHTVELSNGVRHVFHQFGAGTFEGAGTYLSKYMILSPMAMYHEALALKKLGVDLPMDLISVSPDSLVTTPYHQMANQLREKKRGSFKHGSCGMGIGETVEYSHKFPESTLRVGDLTVKSLAKEKMSAIRKYYLQEFEEEIKESGSGLCTEDTMARVLHDMHEWYTDVSVIPDEDAILSMLAEGNIVFEGAQGTLLDATNGFNPHTTWSNTTFENAFALLKVAQDNHEISKVGVLRPYFTRHGAGPFVTEDKVLQSQVPIDKTNVTNEWQDSFRVGHFDMKLAKYALKVNCQVDELVLSCMDHISNLPKYQVCKDYNIKGNLSDSLLKWAKPIYEEVKVKNIVPYLADNLDVQIRILSYGPTFQDKKVI